MIEKLKVESSFEEIFTKGGATERALAPLRRQYQDYLGLEAALSDVKKQLLAKLKGTNIKSMNNGDLIAAFKLLHYNTKERPLFNLRDHIVVKLEKEIINRLLEVFDKVGIITISIRSQNTKNGLDIHCVLDNKTPTATWEKLEKLNLDFIRQIVAKEDQGLLLRVILEPQQVLKLLKKAFPQQPPEIKDLSEHAVVIPPGAENLSELAVEIPHGAEDLSELAVKIPDVPDRLAS